MQAMGPEAAVLSARLAELRATYVDGGTELPLDGAIWAEAAVLAAERGASEELAIDRRTGLWDRLRGAFARRTDRGPATPRDTGVSLACLPLRAGVRR